MSSGNDSICAMSTTSTYAPSSVLLELPELLLEALELELSLLLELELSLELELLESEPLLELEDDRELRQLASLLRDLRMRIIRMTLRTTPEEQRMATSSVLFILMALLSVLGL